MNCIIPGLNLKVFAKALHSLAKVGENLYIEAKSNKVTLIALNLRRTVCVQFHFFENFFSCYEVKEDETESERVSVNCKAQMRTLLPLFKGTQLEKKLDFLKIEYENSSDMIVFKMKYKRDDIIMIHKLRLMEPEVLTIQISTDAGSNYILGSSSIFNQLSNMFSQSDDEITLETSLQKVIARNHCVGAPLRPKSVRSQVNLNGSEFSTFRISGESIINFSLRPFRTAIQFADSFGLNIGLNFDKGGRPLTVIMENPTFEGNFIIATIDPYGDGKSSASTPIPTKVTQVNNDKPNVTVEDQEALLNENWSKDFNADSDKSTKSATKKAPQRASFQEILAKAKNTTKSQAGLKNGTNQNKLFNLPWESPPQDVEDQNDVIPGSPESPKTKKARVIFGRCFESTFSHNKLGQVLAPNSDSE